MTGSLTSPVLIGIAYSHEPSRFDSVWIGHRRQWVLLHTGLVEEPIADEEKPLKGAPGG